MVNEQAEAGLLQFARFSRLDGPGDKLQSRIAEIEKQLGAMLFDLAYIKRTRKRVSLIELAVLLPELKVEAMLLQGVGDTAAVEPVLQLTHAVVVERGAVDRVDHGGLGAYLRHVSHHSRPPP